MKSLKIGFDAKRLFHNKEGLGSYARTLIRDLVHYYPDHHYFLFVPTVNLKADPFFLDSARFTIVQKAKGQSSAWWRRKGMLRDIENCELDVYLGLTNELPAGIKKLAVLAIVVIHDLIYRTYPKQFTWIDRIIYSRKFKQALHEADKVVAISQSTQRDLNKYYPWVQSKVTVIYQAVSADFRRAEIIEIKGSYLLMVGSVTSRKNHELLIRSYSEMDPKDRKLVKIVGRGKQYKAFLKQLINQFDLTEWFEFVAYIDNKDLIDLYQGALALVFVSHYEGFGIPLLEALTLRLPVIAHKNSSIAEVLGNYGIIVEYNNHISLKEVIIKIDGLADKSSRFVDLEDHLQKFEPKKLSQLIFNQFR